MLEFIDCFELNLELLNNQNNNFIDFELFANFYCIHLELKLKFEFFCKFNLI